MANKKTKTQSESNGQTTRGRNRAYDLILSDILRGKLSPGDRLVEASLAERIGVSRTPLREALFQLEQEGFVRSELRRGFSVKPLSEREAREVFPIVGALEGLALVQSGILAKSSLSKLREANKVLLACRGGPRKAFQADHRFHQLLLSHCSNSHLLALIGNLHKILLRYEHLYMSDQGLIGVSVEQHNRILQDIAEGNIPTARQALEFNYQTGMDAVLSKILFEPKR